MRRNDGARARRAGRLGAGPTFLVPPGGPRGRPHGAACVRTVAAAAAATPGETARAPGRAVDAGHRLFPPGVLARPADAALAGPNVEDVRGRRPIADQTFYKGQSDKRATPNRSSSIYSVSNVGDIRLEPELDANRQKDPKRGLRLIIDESNQ